MSASSTTTPSLAAAGVFIVGVLPSVIAGAGMALSNWDRDLLATELVALRVFRLGSRLARVVCKSGFCDSRVATSSDQRQEAYEYECIA